MLFLTFEHHLLLEHKSREPLLQDTQLASLGLLGSTGARRVMYFSSSLYVVVTGVFWSQCPDPNK